MYEKNIDPEFFDLRSGIAGEILQKYVNYQYHLAIVGDFSDYYNKALQAFIIQYNRGRHIRFVQDRDSALEKLNGTSEA